MSTVGRASLAQQIDWIRIAAATPNVKRFLPSEFGTDVEHGPKSSAERPHQQKLKIRAFLRTVEDSLDYTYVVTGPFCDVPGFFSSAGYNARVPAPEEIGFWDVKGKRAVLLGDGNGKIAFTTNRE